MKINLQKAMKIRTEIKSEISMLIYRLGNAGYFESKSWKKSELSEDEVQKFLDNARNQMPEVLDGLTRDQFIMRIIELQDALFKLNCEIEKSNQEVHLLLIEETYVKSRISLIDKILEEKRGRKVRREYNEMVAQLAEKQSVMEPFVEVNAFALDGDFVKMSREWQKRLSSIRDEISVINAKTMIEVDIPEDLI